MSTYIKRVSLEAQILFLIRHYGSEAGERENPGSRSRSQARIIADTFYKLMNVEQAVASVDTGDVSIDVSFAGNADLIAELEANPRD